MHSSKLNSENIAVSIVMPLYNKARHVLDTVASVLGQSLDNWELVVVDDGSTDGGAELVRSLGDARIRVVSQVNSGVSVARNRGVEIARADLITFLDADDIWYPEFLSVILSLEIDYPEAFWFATSYEVLLPRGDRYVSRLRGISRSFQRGLFLDYFTIASRSDPPVCASAVAVRRAAFLSIGGFPIGIGSGEDLLTWARLATRYPLAYDTKPMALWKVSGIERPPDPLYRVENELRHLLYVHTNIRGLTEYLGHWCQVQAVLAMLNGDLVLARRVACRSINYDALNTKNIYILFLTLLPLRFGKILHKMARVFIKKISRR